MGDPATAGWRNVLHHLTEEQGAAYYVPNYVMEQHGEWDLCDIHTSKTGCFAEELPSGYTNLIDFPLDFEGELNDGRRVGAPDLNFWLEIGLGWTYDVTSRKPLSYAVITEDHFGMVDGHQHTYENYHWVPSTGEWVNYYTGRMPTSGNLVRMKHHVHMNLMYRAYFIATSADELELSACPIGPDGEEMAQRRCPAHSFRTAAPSASSFSIARRRMQGSTLGPWAWSQSTGLGIRTWCHLRRRCLRVRAALAGRRDQHQVLAHARLSRGRWLPMGPCWPLRLQIVALRKGRELHQRLSAQVPREARSVRGRRTRRRLAFRPTTSGTCTLNRTTTRRTTFCTRPSSTTSSEDSALCAARAPSHDELAHCQLTACTDELPPRRSFHERASSRTRHFGDAGTVPDSTCTARPREEEQEERLIRLARSLSLGRVSEGAAPAGWMFVFMSCTESSRRSDTQTRTPGACTPILYHVSRCRSVCAVRPSYVCVELARTLSDPRNLALKKLRASFCPRLKRTVQSLNAAPAHRLTSPWVHVRQRTFSFKHLPRSATTSLIRVQTRSLPLTMLQVTAHPCYVIDPAHSIAYAACSSRDISR